MDNTIIVFTAKDIKKTIEQGGSGNWKLNVDRAKRCDYAVLTANSHHAKSAHPKSSHRKAFMIGRISDLSPNAYDDLGNIESSRWVIQFDEYAELNLPDSWQGFQNPVKYTDLSELGINPEALDWKPFPTDQVVDQTQESIRSGAFQASADGIADKPFTADKVAPDHSPASIRPLTIEEAKAGIAEKFGVSPDCIEITIRV